VVLCFLGMLHIHTYPGIGTLELVIATTDCDFVAVSFAGRGGGRLRGSRVCFSTTSFA
jgi:hypothetical protein